MPTEATPAPPAEPRRRIPLRRLTPDDEALVDRIVDRHKRGDLYLPVAAFNSSI